MKFSVIFRFLSFVVLVAMFSSCSSVTKPEEDSSIIPGETPEFSYVDLKTSKGDIVLQLYNKKAPLTVKNFLNYVDNGHYKNTIFHRVKKNFMIQGGGFDKNMKMIPAGDPIRNEAGNGVKNTRGSIAMARTVDPHSAKAQFFINVRDNNFLNFKDESVEGYGYCVFGKVIDGMDVVEKIQNSSTHTEKQYRNVPVKDIVIFNIEKIPEPTDLLKKIESESSKQEKSEE